MMIDQKTVITSAVTFAVTAAFGLFIGSIAGVFERGSEALTEDKIKEVLMEIMVLDNGQTYGQALSSINTTLAVTEQRLGAMEAALIALTEE